MLSIIMPMIGLLVVAMFRFSLSVATPALMQEYVLLESEAGILLSSYFSATALTTIVGGYLSDRLGRRIIPAGFTVTALAFYLFGYSHS